MEKTVEIINTDAEGRLILADVFDYAHGLQTRCNRRRRDIDRVQLSIALGK